MMEGIQGTYDVKFLCFYMGQTAYDTLRTFACHESWDRFLSGVA